MERVCMLKSEIRKCQYMVEGNRCNAPNNKCGMLVKLDMVKEEKRPYTRQTRWYEKYYQ